MLAMLVLLLAANTQALDRKSPAGFTLTAAPDGLRIASVRPVSNAEGAGLRVDDVIVQVGDAKVEVTGAFARTILRRPVGDRVTLRVRRASETLTLAMSYRDPGREQPRDLTVLYDAARVDGHERRMLITQPKGSGRKPVLIWIAGSGCGSQESVSGDDSVVSLLYDLTRRGIATVRVEKTGVGDSEGPPCYSDEGGLAQEVRGYRAAIEGIGRFAFADPQRVFVFGHSAGATLAPMVAEGLAVKGAVLAGAMGIRFFDYILEMRGRELVLDGKSEQETQATLAVQKRCLTRLLVDGATPDTIEKEMPDCKRKVRFDSPPRYIADWAVLDLETLWKKAPPAPVLVLYGSGDFVTSEAQSAALVATINRLRPGSAQLKTLPMDHGFLAHAKADDAWRAERGSGPAAGLYARVVDAVADWLLGHARR